jgi:hypothetical protein
LKWERVTAIANFSVFKIDAVNGSIPVSAVWNGIPISRLKLARTLRQKRRRGMDRRSFNKLLAGTTK